MLTGMFIFQEADFAVSPYTLTPQRSEVVNFMTPFFTESMSFMVLIPDENIFLKVKIQPCI